MNDMTIALTQAGVKLPTGRQRIWNWLKDHPHKTARDVLVALKLPAGTVSGALSKLESGGFVVANHEPVRPGGRVTAHYSVSSTEYSARARVHIPAPKPTPPAPKAFDPEKLLGDCTIRQLRDVQKWLNNLLPANV